jgi:CHAD domain-containing protein
MIPDCLINFAQKRLANIERHFEDSSVHCGINSIHDLRVEIKRLRAILTLVKCLKPDYKNAKYYKKVRPLFKEAGKVRDIHVQMMTIREAMNNHRLELSEYYNTLKSRETRLRSDYLTFCDGFKTSALDTITDSLRDFPGSPGENDPDENLRNCFQERLNEIVSLKRQAYLTPAEYHQIRIRTKTARYILEVVRECFSDEQRYLDLNEGLKAIHQVLGLWHDKEVGILMLQDFLENETTGALFDILSYQKYINILKNEKIDSLGSFENRWSHFVKLLGIHSFIYPD